MNAQRAVLACWAAASVAAACSGGCASLTAVPPVVMCAAGVIVATIALRRKGETWWRLVPFGPAFVGAAVGFALAWAPPTVPGGVVTHVAEHGARGDIFGVLARLDDDPSSVIGTRVTVSGAWTPATADALATVARRVMSCCAADAVAVGFDVRPRHRVDIAAGSIVRVDGIVGRTMVDGEVRYVLEQSEVTRLEERP